jgi:hypothetical protein
VPLMAGPPPSARGLGRSPPAASVSLRSRRQASLASTAGRSRAKRASSRRASSPAERSSGGVVNRRRGMPLTRPVRPSCHPRDLHIRHRHRRCWQLSPPGSTPMMIPPPVLKASSLTSPPLNLPAWQGQGVRQDTPRRIAVKRRYRRIACAPWSPRRTSCPSSFACPPRGSPPPCEPPSGRVDSRLWLAPYASPASASTVRGPSPTEILRPSPCSVARCSCGQRPTARRQQRCPPEPRFRFARGASVSQPRRPAPARDEKQHSAPGPRRLRSNAWKAQLAALLTRESGSARLARRPGRRRA